MSNQYKVKIDRKEWILLLLSEEPLDRIHIMKALFLIWLRSGKHIKGFFKFEPYLYGPYSLDVYSELDSLLSDGSISQPPYSAKSWVSYFITDEGMKNVNDIKNEIKPEIRKLISSVVKEISSLDFFSLLRKVYREAPDFAKKSIFGGMTE